MGCLARTITVTRWPPRQWLLLLRRTGTPTMGLRARMITATLTLRPSLRPRTATRTLRLWLRRRTVTLMEVLRASMTMATRTVTRLLPMTS